MGLRPQSRLLAAIAVLALGWCGGARAAEAPVALVMSVNGRTDPPLAARSPVESGMRVRLGNEVRLTFVVFGQCGLYTAAGGTIVFQRPEPKMEGGILARGHGPCSRAHILAKGEEMAIAGGAVLRGQSSGATVPPRPEFIVSGEGAWRVNGAWLIPPARDRSHVSLVLEDGRLRLPEEAPSLPPGRYELRILVPVGESPTPLQVTVSENADESVDVVLVR